MKATQTTELTRQVAARLRARRAFLKLTQQEVSDATGGILSSSTLSRIEDGDRAIEIEFLVPVCAALGLDPMKVLEESWNAQRLINVQRDVGGESTGGLRVAR